MKFRLRTWLLIFLFLGFVFAASGLWWIGSELGAPMQRDVGPPPSDLDVESVEFATDAGTTLRGWLIDGEPGRGAVMLLHGIHADRRSMIGRARFLSEAGYTVLLFDHRGHGESEGDRITFGHLESRDAAAATRFVREILPGRPVAALGSSLGGAACLLGEGPVDVDALILEAVYPDVKTAVKNRLQIRFGKPGAWLSPLLTMQLPFRLGISVEDLSPERKIGKVTCPVLMVAGTEDRRTRIEDSRRLFDAAPEPKELYLLEGARHVDLHRHGGEEYRSLILDFLDRSLR